MVFGSQESIELLHLILEAVSFAESTGDLLRNRKWQLFFIKTDLSQKQPFKLLKIHYIIAMRQ